MLQYMWIGILVSHHVWVSCSIRVHHSTFHLSIFFFIAVSLSLSHVHNVLRLVFALNVFNVKCVCLISTKCGNFGLLFDISLRRSLPPRYCYRLNWLTLFILIFQFLSESSRQQQQQQNRQMTQWLVASHTHTQRERLARTHINYEWIRWKRDKWDAYTCFGMSSFYHSGILNSYKVAGRNENVEDEETNRQKTHIRSN